MYGRLRSMRLAEEPPGTWSLGNLKSVMSLHWGEYLATNGNSGNAAVLDDQRGCQAGHRDSVGGGLVALCAAPLEAREDGDEHFLVLYVLFLLHEQLQYMLSLRGVIRNRR